MGRRCGGGGGGWGQEGGFSIPGPSPGAEMGGAFPGKGSLPRGASGDPREGGIRTLQALRESGAGES